MAEPTLPSSRGGADDGLNLGTVEGSSAPPRDSAGQIGAFYSGAWCELFGGDCREVMGPMEANIFDAIVTDPPYGLPGGFMGKDWDRFGSMEDTGFGYYLAGRIDAAGRFEVRSRHGGPDAHPQRNFYLQLEKGERGLLDQARRFLGHGRVEAAPRSRGGGYQWTVSDEAGCVALVQMLGRFPLRTGSRAAFEAWAAAGDTRRKDGVERRNGSPASSTAYEAGHGSPSPVEDSQPGSEGVPETLNAGRRPAWSGNRYQDWCRTWALQALRVLKPGAFLLAFGSNRTYHRLAAGIEDAGFEILDTIQWLFGQGSPAKCRSLAYAGRPELGMALKPAHEPILVARKPLDEPTLARNVSRHGTGALRVDPCRIPVSSADDGVWGSSNATVNPQRKFNGSPGAAAAAYRSEQHPLGRWPANVLLSCCGKNFDAGAGATSGACSGCPVAALDRESGRLKSEANPTRRSSAKYRNTYTPWGASAACEPARGEDSGGASRFFYVAKARSAEREMGLEDFEETPLRWSSGQRNPGSFQSNGTRRASRNPHPTIKPVELVRYLLRLVAGPASVVLDPFAGSGTTGVAATLEEMRAVLIEQEDDYLPVISAKAEFAARIGPQPDEPLGIVPSRKSPSDGGQEPLPMEIPG